MLTIKNLDVYYNKLYTLKKVSLHINKGEIVTLIGSNGAGKTTLLNAISGLVKSSSGNITFEGKEISKETPDKIVNIGISQVPEGRLIFKTLTCVRQS
jgi:branched-chain amino acid transport system ATP-binding protein